MKSFLAVKETNDGLFFAFKSKWSDWRYRSYVSPLGNGKLDTFEQTWQKKYPNCCLATMLCFADLNRRIFFPPEKLTKKNLILFLKERWSRYFDGEETKDYFFDLVPIHKSRDKIACVEILCVKKNLSSLLRIFDRFHRHIDLVGIEEYSYLHYLQKFIRKFPSNYKIFLIPLEGNRKIIISCCKNRILSSNQYEIETGTISQIDLLKRIIQNNEFLTSKEIKVIAINIKPSFFLKEFSCRSFEVIYLQTKLIHSITGKPKLLKNEENFYFNSLRNLF